MAIVSELSPALRTATALSIIKRATRLIGVTGIDSPLTPEEAQDGLEALNAMLGSWANEKLMIYAPSLDVVALTPGQAAYTIGPGAAIDTARPVSIDPMSYVLWGNISYPLAVLTAAEYNGIWLKDLDATIPQAIWYLPTFPSAQITLYGIPSEAMTLYLWSWKALGTFATTTTAVELPPGYEDALAYNLAVRIAPEYERPVAPDVKTTAIMSKKLLKRTNFEPLTLGFPGEVLPERQFNIYSGR